MCDKSISTKKAKAKAFPIFIVIPTHIHMHVRTCPCGSKIKTPHVSINPIQSLMQLHLLVQTMQGKEDNSKELTTLAAGCASPCIHFIETEPSVLRDVPWIQLKEHKVLKAEYSWVQIFALYNYSSMQNLQQTLSWVLNHVLMPGNHSLHVKYLWCVEPSFLRQLHVCPKKRGILHISNFPL